MIVSTIDYVHCFNLVISSACLHCKQLSSEKFVSDPVDTVLQNLSKWRSDFTDAVLGKTEASPPQDSRILLYLPRGQGTPQASSNVVRELQAPMAS